MNVKYFCKINIKWFFMLFLFLHHNVNFFNYEIKNKLTNVRCFCKIIYRWKLFLITISFTSLIVSYSKPICGPCCPNTTEHNGDALQHFITRRLSHDSIFTSREACKSTDTWKQFLRCTTKLCGGDGVIILTRLWHNSRIVHTANLWRSRSQITFK